MRLATIQLDRTLKKLNVTFNSLNNALPLTKNSYSKLKTLVVLPLLCWDFSMIINCVDLVFTKEVICGTTWIQSITEDHDFISFG